MAADSTTIKQLIGRIANDDGSAKNELVTLLYDELRRIAGSLMRNERPVHTLQPTALVAEAFINLERAVVMDNPRSRAYFVSAAAQAMRDVLREHARRRNAQKRKPDGERSPWDVSLAWFEESGLPFFDLDEAMESLASVDKLQHEIVQLKYFGGLTNEQVAELLDISARTVERKHKLAKSWLRSRIGATEDE
ncbi:MAG: ECF-type sigma factor [Phycisphaerales bacterium]|nr:ECF-type sigma factor [Phycisphaerales bacterium]